MWQARSRMRVQVGEVPAGAESTIQTLLLIDMQPAFGGLLPERRKRDEHHKQARPQHTTPPSYMACFGSDCELMQQQMLNL